MPEHHHQLYLTDILDSGRAIQSYEAIAKLVIPAKAGIQCFCNILKFLDSGFRRNDRFLPFWAFATASYVQDIAFDSSLPTGCAAQPLYVNLRSSAKRLENCRKQSSHQK